ncbi:hypothetical protein Tco_0072280 [Tanacetum coccineum]
MIPFLVAPRVSALTGCDRLVSEPMVIENILAMFSPTSKKSRWGTVFPPRLKSYMEPLVEPKEIGYSLIPLSRRSFDVIVGIDWLSKRKFVIVCHEKVVRILLDGDEILQVHGERTQGVVKLSDVSVVRDFIDVFPEDLSMTTTTTRWNSGDDQNRLRMGDLLHTLANGTEALVRFRKKGKLAPRYVGPFEILKRIGLVAYRLRLLEELNSVHDTFHVSNLKKCLADANLHVPLDEIKVDKTLRFVEEPVEIMNREIKKLKRRKITLMKVRWNSKRSPEFTWEHEDHIRIKYPQLLVDRVVEPAS